MWKMHKRLIGKIIDVDANLLHPDLINNLTYHVDNAEKRNVAMFVVPGSTLSDSQAAVNLMKSNPLRYIATAGVHPYNTNTQECQFNEENAAQLEQLLVCNSSSTSTSSSSSSDDSERTSSSDNNVVVCVGECGLDYSDGFPAREHQMPWFAHQVDLAARLSLPLYLHVRGAHTDFMDILNRSFPVPIPSLTGAAPLRGIVHCFTGNYEELCCYLNRGLYIGLTGFIMNHTSPTALAALTSSDTTAAAAVLTHERDAEMRRWLERITLNRLLVETDAPYMGFPGCRVSETVDSVTPVNAKNAKRNLTQKYPNVPSSIILLIEYIAAITGWSKKDIVSSTTTNAIRLFQIKN